MLIQALDFYQLNKDKNCELQIGGSDQWGNITAGVELIRRRSGKTAYGMTFPLLMTSDGRKMGKSESGNVWVDPALTSPYQFYQYLLNVADADVAKMLRLFTFIPNDEIVALEKESAQQPEARIAQRRLASEVTTWVHGKDETDRAIRASEVLFSGDVRSVDSVTLLQIFSDVPSELFESKELEGGLPIADVLVRVRASDSKGAARRAIEGGGIYINNDRVSDLKRVITRSDFIDGNVLVVRSGKKNYFLARAS